jgi:drug/metabolite transporter (DMT)-like permease
MARTIGILLILAGVVALLYGGFGYQGAAHSATLGPPHLALIDDQQMPVAPLAGAIALAAGLLFFVVSIPRPRARARVGS